MFKHDRRSLSRANVTLVIVHSRGESRSMPILANRWVGLFSNLPTCKKDTKERFRIKEEESKQQVQRDLLH